MIIAKSERGLAHFKQLFQQKSTADTIAEKEAVSLKKFYRAVVSLTTVGKQFLDEIMLPAYIQEEVHAKVPYYIPKMGITKIVSFVIDKDRAVMDMEILT